jgi:hypothetical protein
MSNAAPAHGTQEWLDQVVEPIIDPDRRIIDPHHHLWPPDGALLYGPNELAFDTASGHNVVATIFVECSSAYLTDGPRHLKPVQNTSTKFSMRTSKLARVASVASETPSPVPPNLQQ